MYDSRFPIPDPWVLVLPACVEACHSLTFGRIRVVVFVAKTPNLPHIEVERCADTSKISLKADETHKMSIKDTQKKKTREQVAGQSAWGRLLSSGPRNGLLRRAPLPEYIQFSCPHHTSSLHTLLEDKHLRAGRKISDVDTQKRTNNSLD